ncbi:serine hydrolase [Psychrobium sp. 1_MG-2023]|uniref:serine hydrolase domain-containing protein n=1 Tax=Psychrobium sp. 1_MG-2023 TaxID=3062624 RepID=UPI000C33E2D7|nr:serine hydrolase domain-containing protein [Psychrobium sp. 1_MG-2023]MDP2562917.1 serine hydrolase domain-containing protein [Psychrobium sp. 1_MG-2023]PKF53755.1 hypothetical protein CW748_17695 [Alteromonadales bacterium alter-6D02]
MNNTLKEQTINKFTSLCAMFMLSFSAIATVNAAEQVKDNIEQLSKEIESIRISHNVPAIGVTLIKSGEAKYTQVFGDTSKVSNTAATADSLFRFGSITKVIPGIAILQLQEQGKLSLDDNIRSIAPELAFENPWHATNPIKVEHLLEHTTGWDSHPAEQKIYTNDNNELKEVLEIYPQSRVSRWVPGTRSAYSNTGPTVAARIVEIVTGMSFSTYVQKHIFQPLQMHNSHLLKPKSWDTQGVLPYLNNGLSAGYEHIATRPASSLTASMTDMNQLLNLFLYPEQSKILSAASVERMQRIESELAYQNGLVSFQGFAHVKDMINNELFFGHNGGIPGAISSLRYSPTSKTGYVFALTSANGAAFSKIKKVLTKFIQQENSETKLTSSAKKALHSDFNNAAGLYTKINSSMSLGNIISYFSDAVQVTATKNTLAFTWLKGGYQLSYHQQSDSPVLSNKDGLPQVTLAQDPIEGQVLLRNADVYVQTSPGLFYAKLVGLLLSIVLIVTSIIYTLYTFFVRPVIKLVTKNNASLSQPRTLVCVSSTLLLTAIMPILLVGEFALFNNLYWISPLLTVMSVLYPLITLIAGASCIKHFKNINKGFHRLYLSSIVLAHCVLALYLLSYQLVAVTLSA